MGWIAICRLLGFGDMHRKCAEELQRPPRGGGLFDYSVRKETESTTWTYSPELKKLYDALERGYSRLLAHPLTHAKLKPGVHSGNGLMQFCDLPSSLTNQMKWIWVGSIVRDLFTTGLHKRAALSWQHSPSSVGGMRSSPVGAFYLRGRPLITWGGWGSI